MIFMLILQFFCTVKINEIASCANLQTSSAEAMATMEVGSGRLLYAKNENKRLPMASTTKIITAIVAIENCTDLDKVYMIPREAVGIEGSSIYLKEGEHLSVRELLYGLMLRSGNDSAVAIAIIVGGSVENFVKMMNDFCVRLSLENTSVVTVNGLHDDKHFTSASDLAKVTCYALANETFAEIVSTREKTVSNEFAKGGHRFLKNKNRLLNMIDGADGVKTGYTRKAGRCFVGSATRNGMQVVCVVLNCQPMFEECAALLEKAFEEFSLYKLLPAGEIYKTNITDGKVSYEVPVLLHEDIYFPLTKSEMKKVTAKPILYDNLHIPILNNTEIGVIEIKIENNLIFSKKLYTINIEKIKDEGFVKKFIEAF